MSDTPSDDERPAAPGPRFEFSGDPSETNPAPQQPAPIEPGAYRPPLPPTSVGPPPNPPAPYPPAPPNPTYSQRAAQPAPPNPTYSQRAAQPAPPNPTYGQPAAQPAPPNPTYSQPAAQPAPPNPTYSQPAPPNPTYSQPAPPNPTYGQPTQPSLQPPPPGWGHAPPPAPPPKSNNRRMLWIFLGIAAVLALAVGACSVWFVSTVKAPVDEANRFLAAIDDRNYGAAAAMADPVCSQGMTAADIEALFQGRDITYDLKNSQITNSSAVVTGRFSMSGTPLDFVEVSLRNNDGWRVCGVFVSDR